MLIPIYLISITIFYLYVFLKKDSIPILNFYFGINLIIFYIPALIFVFFGLIHPSHGYSIKKNFDYQDYLLNTLNLILIFDLTVILFFKFFNFFKIKLKIFFTLFNKIEKNYSDKFIILFSIIILSISIFFDILLIILNKSFLNKDALECFAEIYNLDIEFFLGDNLIKFIQLFKSFSIFKYFLLCFVALINKKSKNKVSNIILIVTLIYCLFYGFLISSRFQIIIPLVLVLFINFEKIFKLFNFISLILFSVLASYLFPVIGTIRNLFRKNDSNICIMDTKIYESITDNISYNNSYKVKLDTIINFEIQNFPILAKPIDIILSRLNYFDTTIRIYHYRIKENLVNNFGYFFDNLYGLIPRFIYPNKKIITNSSEIWGVELGILQNPTHAVGFRPIGEAFLFLGNYYLIIAALIGIFLSLMYKLQESKVIILNTIFIYITILFLKRDSLHAFIPGLVHELIAGFVFILIYILIKKYTKAISQ